MATHQTFARKAKIYFDLGGRHGWFVDPSGVGLALIANFMSDILAAE